MGLPCVHYLLFDTEKSGCKFEDRFFFLRHADIQWHRVTYAVAYHNTYQWNNYLGDEAVLTQSEEEAYEKDTKAAVRKRIKSATGEKKAKRCKIDDRINDSEASFDIEHNSTSVSEEVTQGHITSSSMT